MARSKSKKPHEEAASSLLDSSGSSRKTSSFTSPALLFIIIIFTFLMGWFCVQQQQSLDQLSESFTTVQTRITHLQQVMEATEAQTDTDLGVEERIFALEEAQKQAQERAEAALATTENLKKSDLLSQLLTLHDEMDTRLTEIKQVSLSITALQAMFKNQSEEFEVVKESVLASLSSNLVLVEHVDGLTNAVASASSRAEEQVASVKALNEQLEGQASELNELKESMRLHNVALYTNKQEMAAIKKLLEAKHVMRVQALEEMLSSVQMTLDEQFFTSQTLHSSVMAQLQTFHAQLTNAPSWSMKLQSSEEGQAAAKFISAQDATEVQEIPEDVKEKAELQGAEEEEEKEEAMQEEQPLEQEMNGDATEEEEEEEITEEKEDEEMTRQSEEQEVVGETAEEIVDGQILDKSLENELSEDHEVLMEEHVEDK